MSADALPIIIGCDHGAFTLKETIRKHLAQSGYPVEDAGAFGTESVDYPDVAHRLAERVAGGEFARGILLCGTGIGMSIAANKVTGIRASLCTSVDAARTTVQHNDSNVICISGDGTDWGIAEAMVDAWLAAEFEGGRHGRRVDLITAYENRRD